MRYNIDISDTAYVGDAENLKLNHTILSNILSINKDENTIELITEFISFIEDKNNCDYDFNLIRLNKEQAAILGRILIELSK